MEAEANALRPTDTGWNKKAVAAIKARYSRQNWLAMLVIVIVGIAYPLLPGVEGWQAYTVALIIIYIIAAQGLAVLVGYTGLVSVGHGGFLAIGAYSSALLTKYFETDLVAALFVGGLTSGVIGIILGLIFLRLSGAFLAIGTLGFAFFVGTVVNNVPIFQGREGISLPSNTFLWWEIGDVGFYYVSLGVCALVTLFMFCLIKSGVGRAFMALRDAERAAEASGVNRVFYRSLAFAISAAITGLAGVLNAHIVNYVSSEVYGDIWYSVDILVAVVVGGAAMLMGPIVGGVFVVMLPFFLEQLADFAFILKGVVLILVLIFAPAGIVELVSRPIRNMRRRRILEAGGSLNVTGEPETGRSGSAAIKGAEATS